MLTFSSSLRDKKAPPSVLNDADLIASTVQNLKTGILTLDRMNFDQPPTRLSTQQPSGSFQSVDFGAFNIHFYHAREHDAIVKGIQRAHLASVLRSNHLSR